jgi:tripartite-type tricarboxylate transporter receptor subunit TctC
MSSRPFLTAAAVALALLACLHPVAAQDYPSRPIHLIVPYLPGTSTDLAARQITGKLASVLGGQILVDNRGGASGIIGAEAVAHAAPDGYTLLFATSQTQAINASLYAKLPYDSMRDFTPIERVVGPPMILVVPASLGLHSVAELVAYAKARPGKINFASSGIGTTAHLCGSLFGSEIGQQLTHVPYNSMGQALTDLVNGEVTLMFYGYQPLEPMIHAKKLVALATTAGKRSSYLPDVPTMAESGYSDFVITAWFAMYGPAKLPPAIQNKIATAVAETLKDKDVNDRLLATGTDPYPAGPEELAAFTRSEIERYRKVVAIAGAKVE